jgi:hypothetical protein
MGGKGVRSGCARHANDCTTLISNFRFQSLSVSGGRLRVSFRQGWSWDTVYVVKRMEVVCGR